MHWVFQVLSFLIQILISQFQWKCELHAWTAAWNTLILLWFCYEENLRRMHHHISNNVTCQIGISNAFIFFCIVSMCGCCILDCHDKSCVFHRGISSLHVLPLLPTCSASASQVIVPVMSHVRSGQWELRILFVRWVIPGEFTWCDMVSLCLLQILDVTLCFLQILDVTLCLLQILHVGHPWFHGSSRFTSECLGCLRLQSHSPSGMAAAGHFPSMSVFGCCILDCNDMLVVFHGKLSFSRCESFPVMVNSRVRSAQS